MSDFTPDGYALLYDYLREMVRADLSDAEPPQVLNDLVGPGWFVAPAEIRAAIRRKRVPSGTLKQRSNEPIKGASSEGDRAGPTNKTLDDYAKKILPVTVARDRAIDRMTQDLFKGALAAYALHPTRGTIEPIPRRLWGTAARERYWKTGKYDFGPGHGRSASILIPHVGSNDFPPLPSGQRGRVELALSQKFPGSDGAALDGMNVPEIHREVEQYLTNHPKWRASMRLPSSTELRRVLGTKKEKPSS